MEQLYTKLQGAGLIDAQGNIILEIYPNGLVQTVDKPTFETFFGDVSANPTYTAISGSHNFTWNGSPTTATATQLGYQTFFDQWKAKGILS